MAPVRRMGGQGTPRERHGKTIFVSINREARFDDTAFAAQSGHPLDELRALLAESRITLPADLPAASAGLFGYLAYDMIRLVEDLPQNNPDPLDLPDAILLRPSVVAVLDGVKGEVTVVSPAWITSGLSARRCGLPNAAVSHSTFDSPTCPDTASV